LTEWPTGQTLVIEDASATCNKSVSDVLVSLALRLGIGGAGAPTIVTRVIPLGVQGTETPFKGSDTGANRLTGFTSGRTYYAPGSQVAAMLTMAGPATQPINCAIHLSGHLVSAP
jgi:hypothetical protein